MVRRRKTDEPCKVLFLLGPRHGNYRDYPRDPVVIGCITEATKAGMHGIYRTTEFKDDQITMTWVELPNDKRP